MQTTSQPRLLEPAELAFLIKTFREIRKWSQELLSEISGLSVRTIQRMERGDPSDLDSRRAIARAFEFEDIDALNKPYSIPTAEEIKAEQEKFEREHITLKAFPLTTGKQLATLASSHTMDMSSGGFEMSREADEQFAVLVDYMRYYRDCSSDYSEAAKFEIYDELQALIDALKALDVSLCYATRKVRLMTKGADAEPWETTVLYMVTFPAGQEPKEFLTPKKFQIGF